jgi:hypothetical protein
MADVALASKPTVSITMKGIGFANVRQFVTTNYNDKKWDEVINLLSPQDRDVIRSAAAIGWYNVSLFGRLLRAVDMKCGRGDLSLVNKIGAYEAEQDINRVFRIFIRVLEPNYIFKMHKRLWSHFFSSGEIHLFPVECGIDVVLNEWEEDEALCIELTAYLVRLIEFNGGKNVTGRVVKCKGRGDRRCFSQFRWK